MLLAAEGGSSMVEDVLEKFALPLEFKKVGAYIDDKVTSSNDAAASDEVKSSSSTPAADDLVVTTSSEKAVDLSTFTPSSDTPLANKYYLKKMQMAEEGEKTEAPVEEKTAEITDTPIQTTTPPAPRRADFGIASEIAEPINGEPSMQEPGASTNVDATKLRGFTDLNIRRQRPLKVIGGTRSTGSSPPEEVKPLIGDTAKSPPVETDTKLSTIEEETTPAASTTIEMEERATPSPTPTVSQPSELVQTQPASPLNAITLPINNLNAEDFGLLPLIIIGLGVFSALGIYLNASDESQKKDVTADEPLNPIEKIKEAGTAGAISYALWEAAFWGVSIPVCLVSYREVTGHWPDLTSEEDMKKVGAEAFAFVNFARFAVPLRIGLALSTVPWVEQNILIRFNAVQADDATLQIDGDETQITTSEVNINAGIDPSLLQKKKKETKQRSSVPGNNDRSTIDEYCEQGTVNEDCSESIQGYLDSLASTGAVATSGEVKAIVGYLDSLSNNVIPNKQTGSAFQNYLDALSAGYIPAPTSAKAVKTYLDVLSSDDVSPPPGGSRITEVEVRLSRLETSVTELPDDVASRLEEKLSDEMEKIRKLLVDEKSQEN